MTRTQRINSLSIVTIAAALYAVGCSSSDPPDDSSTSTGGTSASSQTTSAGGASQATSKTSSSSSTGGVITTSGGAGNEGGVSSNTEAGGSTSGGGATSADTSHDPLCGMTVGGLEAKKGTACAAEDVQLCYRTCGPSSVGYKPETCTAGVYAEPSNFCEYPSTKDYSCFKIPAALPDAATCGITAAPQSGVACTAAPCTLCSLNGSYLDSGGASKVGYCVCNEKTDGSKVWSCAGSNIWPCPGSAGC